MSDLAPFVAATLRDKVVMELHEEIQRLQQQLLQEREESQLVTITGPKGNPIYAQANFLQDGNFDNTSPSELWKVEFPSNDNDHNNCRTTATTKIQSGCTLTELADMEIRIGGICKARLTSTIMANNNTNNNQNNRNPNGTFHNNNNVEGFVNDIYNNYCHKTKSGVISLWFGGSSGIWLNISVGPIELSQYAALRDFDLGGGGGDGDFLNILCQFVNPFTTHVQFIEISFLITSINGAMKRWGIIHNHTQRNGQTSTTPQLLDAPAARVPELQPTSRTTTTTTTTESQLRVLPPATTTGTIRRTPNTNGSATSSVTNRSFSSSHNYYNHQHSNHRLQDDDTDDDDDDDEISSTSTGYDSQLGLVSI